MRHHPIEMACSLILQASTIRVVVSRVGAGEVAALVEDSFFSKHELVQLFDQAWWRTLGTLACSLAPNQFPQIDQRIKQALYQALEETALRSFQQLRQISDEELEALCSQTAELCHLMLIESQAKGEEKSKLDTNFEYVHFVLPDPLPQQGELQRALSTQFLTHTAGQHELALLEHQHLLENVFLYCLRRLMLKKERLHQTLHQLQQHGYWFPTNEPTLSSELLKAGIQRQVEQLQTHEAECQQQLSDVTQLGNFAQAQALIAELASLHEKKTAWSALDEEASKVIVEAQMSWQSFGGTFSHFTERFEDVLEALHLSIQQINDFLPEPTSPPREVQPTQATQTSQAAQAPQATAQISQADQIAPHQEAPSRATQMDGEVAPLDVDAFKQSLLDWLKGEIKPLLKQWVKEAIQEARTPNTAPQSNTLPEREESHQESPQEAEEAPPRSQDDVSESRDTPATQMGLEEGEGTRQVLVSEFCQQVALVHRLWVRPLTPLTREPVALEQALSSAAVQALDTIEQLPIHGRSKMGKVAGLFEQHFGFPVTFLDEDGAELPPETTVKSAKWTGSKWSFVVGPTLYLPLKPGSSSSAVPSWKKSKSLPIGKQNISWFLAHGVQDTLSLETVHGLFEAHFDSQKGRIYQLEEIFKAFPKLTPGMVLCLSQLHEREASFALQVLDVEEG